MEKTKERISYIKKDKEQRDIIRQKEIEYTQLEEKYNAIIKDRDYWENKWRELQKGALIYTLDQDGYVVDLVSIPNDFLTTYPQEIQDNIKTALETKLYANNRFIQVVEGNVIIDKERYNKYIGGIL